MSEMTAAEKIFGYYDAVTAVSAAVLEHRAALSLTDQGRDWIAQAEVIEAKAGGGKR